MNSMGEHRGKSDHSSRFVWQWQDGDLVLWDNRATMHLAPIGLPLAPEHREMFRVTCRGQPLIGPSGNTSRLLQVRV